MLPPTSRHRLPHDRDGEATILPGSQWPLAADFHPRPPGGITTRAPRHRSTFATVGEHNPAGRRRKVPLSAAQRTPSISAATRPVSGGGGRADRLAANARRYIAWAAPATARCSGGARPIAHRAFEVGQPVARLLGHPVAAWQRIQRLGGLEPPAEEVVGQRPSVGEHATLYGESDNAGAFSKERVSRGA